jgi:TRAP-type C4-dicarboxylate transport system permease small subunit
MLFSTTTSAYNGLSAVANSAIGSFWPYMVLVIGIPLAFFIIELLIDLIHDRKVDRFVAKTEADYANLDWEGKKR